MSHALHTKKKPQLALAGACLVALGGGSAVAAAADTGQGIPFGQSMTGEMTYYNNIGTDACGGQIDPVTQNLVAVSSGWWTAANPNDDPLCDGVSVQLTYDGHTLTVPVRDKCASCDATHIDVSQAVFQQLAPLSVGVLSRVTWQFVSSSGQPSAARSGSPGVARSGSPGVARSGSPGVARSGSPGVARSGSPGVARPGSPSAARPIENFAVQPIENFAVQPSPSAATAGGCAPAWSASSSYSPGDMVSVNGDNWTSTWWSTGAEPGAPITWKTWIDDGHC